MCSSTQISKRRMGRNGTAKSSMAYLVLAMILCSNFAFVASFTTISNNVISQKKYNRISTTPSSITPRNFNEITTSSLGMAQSDIDGTKTGSYFMAVVLLANVWLFSIPTEFRRAHIYPEGNAGLYTDAKAMTAKEWASGVAEYYANGGGIKFDFSIEGNE